MTDKYIQLIVINDTRRTGSDAELYNVKLDTSYVTVI